jgi:hypothetical protein
VCLRLTLFVRVCVEPDGQIVLDNLSFLFAVATILWRVCVCLRLTLFVRVYVENDDQVVYAHVGRVGQCD